MDKKPLIGVILCLILLLSIAIPVHGERKEITSKNNFESISSKGDIYFLTFAFIIGEYEICWKDFTYFRFWNSDYSIKSIDVLGYKAWEHKWYPVKAFMVEGDFRIGYLGRHQCNIFAIGPALTVQT